jgi:hypothetical protein
MTSISGARNALRVLVTCGALTLLSSCSGGSTEQNMEFPPSLRIWHDPYGEVDWQNDLRLKGQHHDHPNSNLARLKAYDAAGYTAVPLMDYSGSRDPAFGLKQRLWPPEKVLPADFVAELKNIKIWLPNAEEIGQVWHVTSPFLTSYIEPFIPESGALKQEWQYENTRELVELVRQRGGVPTLAHPWYANQPPELGASAGAVEIYSAFAEARRRDGIGDFATRDKNAEIVEYWDKALHINQRVIGVAVNDHFGPIPDLACPPEVRDSGKIIVLARAATLPEYKQAFERGAVFAVKDMGPIKDRFPRVESISVQATSVFIDTPDSVRWIGNGVEIASGNLLEYTKMPPDTLYVRAEISNAEGSVVYTQAFSVRRVGDVDGDGSVDLNDLGICQSVVSGAETHPDRVAACKEWGDRH